MKGKVPLREEARPHPGRRLRRAGARDAASETISDAVRVTLLDRNDSFFFGFSKLEVMLGRQSADDVRLYYRDFAKDGVEFRQETVTAIDPAARRVTTDAGSHDADFLVIAMGADYDMAATPGFEAGGYEYYTLAGAERLRDALADFDGGRVLVSVLAQPFKCPPAPFEGAFLLHEHFTQRGIRDSVEMTSTFPMQRPVPVTGEVSQMFRDGLAARDIAELPQHLVTAIDPATRTAQLRAARRCPTTSSSASRCTGRPIRSRPRASRSTAGSRSTSPTSGPSFPTSTPSATSAPARGPSPRPGSSPSRPRSSWPTTSRPRSRARSHRRRTKGSGVCYAEFGEGLVSKVEVSFLRAAAPAAERIRPVGRVRRREGAVRRDAASALVRVLISGTARPHAQGALRTSAPGG